MRGKKVVGNVNGVTETPASFVDDVSVPPEYLKRSGGVLVKTMKSKRYRKPDLMVILTCSVALGVVLSSVAQAAEPAKIVQDDPVSTLRQLGSEIISGEWLQSFGDIDLAARMKNWRPKIEVDKGGDGLRISHPFGGHGPALKFSTSVPGHVSRSLRAGGDSQIGSLSDNIDGYIFLQRRW